MGGLGLNGNSKKIQILGAVFELPAVGLQHLKFSPFTAKMGSILISFDQFWSLKSASIDKSQNIDNFLSQSSAARKYCENMA